MPQNQYIDKKYLPKGMSEQEFVEGYMGTQGPGGEVRGAAGTVAGEVADQVGWDSAADYLHPTKRFGKSFKQLDKSFGNFTGGDFNFKEQLWSNFRNDDGSFDWDRAAPVINAFRDEDFRSNVQDRFKSFSGEKGEFQFSDLANAASGGESKFNVGKFLGNYVDEGEGEFRKQDFMSTVNRLKGAVQSFRDMDPDIQKNIIGLKDYTGAGAGSFAENPDETLTNVSGRLTEMSQKYRNIKDEDTRKGIRRSLEYLNTRNDTGPSEAYTDWIREKVQGSEGEDGDYSLEQLPMLTNAIETADMLDMEPQQLERLHELTGGLKGEGGEGLGEFSSKLRDKVDGMEEEQRKDFSSDLKNVISSTEDFGISGGQIKTLVEQSGGQFDDMSMTPESMINAVDHADAVINSMTGNEKNEAKQALDTLSSEDNQKLLSAFMDGPASEVMGNIDDPKKMKEFLTRGSQLVNAAKDADIDLGESYESLSKASTFIGGKKGEGMSPSQMMNIVVGEDGNVDQQKLKDMVDVGKQINTMQGRLNDDKMRKYLGVEPGEDITLKDLGVDPSFFMGGDGDSAFNVSAVKSGMDLLSGVVTEFEEGDLNPEIVEDAIGSVRNLSKLGILSGPGKGGVARIKSLVSDGEGGVDSDRLSNIMKFMAVGNRVWESLKSGDPEAWAALGGIGLTLAGLFSRLFGGGSGRGQPARQRAGFGAGGMGGRQQVPLPSRQRRQPTQRVGSRSGRVTYPVDWRTMPGRTIR